MRRGPGRHGPVPVAVIGALLVPLAACAEANPLESYTPSGDACDQAVSAIGYADDLLVVLGQEQYQDFDDATTSRLAAVAGTLALEERDWPDRETARQASLVQPLADEAADLSPAEPRAREQALVQYRIEAARLVLVCGRAAGRYR